MQWIIVEESVEGTASEFGPFPSLTEALEFSVTIKMPWSDDFLISVTVKKVSAYYKVAVEVYNVTSTTKES